MLNNLLNGPFNIQPALDIGLGKGIQTGVGKALKGLDVFHMNGDIGAIAKLVPIAIGHHN